MLDYELMLKLNLPDFMVYHIYVNQKFTAVFVFEDLHRPGELMRDFPEYAGVLYDTEDCWDDERNLIHAKVFFYHKADYDDIKFRKSICYIAHRMIELKPGVNSKVTPVYDKTLSNNFDFDHFVDYMLSKSENYQDYTGYVKDESALLQSIQLIPKKARQLSD